MVYMLQVLALVTGLVFGIVGSGMLIFVALNEVREYARARQAMRRIAGQVHQVRISVRADG